MQGREALSAPPRGPQHLPGLLHHRGGELPGVGRGSAGGGTEKDGVVHLVESGPPAGAVLHAGKHLLERPALPQNQPQHQGGVPGRRGHGTGMEVWKVYAQSMEMMGGKKQEMLEGNLASPDTENR